MSRLLHDAVNEVTWGIKSLGLNRLLVSATKRDDLPEDVGLPAELLERIGWELAGDRLLGTLAGLVQASKRYRDIFTPCLYSTVIIPAIKDSSSRPCAFDIFNYRAWSGGIPTDERLMLQGWVQEPNGSNNGSQITSGAKRRRLTTTTRMLSNLHHTTTLVVHPTRLRDTFPGATSLYRALAGMPQPSRSLVLSHDYDNTAGPPPPLADDSLANLVAQHMNARSACIRYTFKVNCPKSQLVKISKFDTFSVHGFLPAFLSEVDAQHYAMGMTAEYADCYVPPDLGSSLNTDTQMRGLGRSIGYAMACNALRYPRDGRARGLPSYSIYMPSEVMEKQPRWAQYEPDIREEIQSSSLWEDEEYEDVRRAKSEVTPDSIDRALTFSVEDYPNAMCDACSRRSELRNKLTLQSHYAIDHGAERRVRQALH